MTPKQFIEKAIEGGWKLKGYTQYEQEAEFFPAVKDGENVVEWNFYWVKILVTTTYRDGKPFKEIKQERMEYILLDPLAWQAVGKVEGWEDICESCGSPRNNHNFRHLFDEPVNPTYQKKMHRMIDALCEGRSIEQFLEML